MYCSSGAPECWIMRNAVPATLAGAVKRMTLLMRRPSPFLLMPSKARSWVWPPGSVRMRRAWIWVPSKPKVSWSRVFFASSAALGLASSARTPGERTRDTEKAARARRVLSLIGDAQDVGCERRAGKRARGTVFW
jgi:hypothetical protein